MTGGKNQKFETLEGVLAHMLQQTPLKVSIGCSFEQNESDQKAFRKSYWEIESSHQDRSTKKRVKIRSDCGGDEMSERMAVVAHLATRNLRAFLKGVLRFRHNVWFCYKLQTLKFEVKVQSERSPVKSLESFQKLVTTK